MTEEEYLATLSDEKLKEYFEDLEADGFIEEIKSLQGYEP